MLSAKMQDRLNDHLNAEIYSSYLYLSMSAYCLSLGLRGFAHWLRLQSDEETLHTMKFYDFIHDNQGRVALRAIQEPPHDFGNIQSVMAEVLKHEQHVTGLINELTALARTEKDYATETFLQWFVNEQVEEESQVQDILDDLKLIGDHGPGLFQMDRELGSRTATTG